MPVSICRWNLPVCTLSPTAQQGLGNVQMEFVRRTALPDMHGRTAGRVRLRSSQNLVCDRRDVTLSEEDESCQILERVAFRPTEVDVWTLAGAITDLEEHRCNRVRHGGAEDPQDPMRANLLADDTDRRSEL